MRGIIVHHHRARRHYEPIACQLHCCGRHDASSARRVGPRPVHRHDLSRRGEGPDTCEIDCSHLKDPQSKAHCEPFITNQACKLYPAYRKITNVVLEKWCKSVKYTIYEPDSWPKQDSEAGAGGMTRSCSVDYLAKYSVDSYFRLAGTPYDTHEILHVYQMGIGGISSLQYIHSLFGPSQL